jgi:hypothetical protein
METTLSDSSCPGLTRASMSYGIPENEDVDGRDEARSRRKGLFEIESALSHETRHSRAARRAEPESITMIGSMVPGSRFARRDDKWRDAPAIDTNKRISVIGG